jgi:hypothetical protein
VGSRGSEGQEMNVEALRTERSAQEVVIGICDWLGWCHDTSIACHEIRGTSVGMRKGSESFRLLGMTDQA